MEGLAEWECDVDWNAEAVHLAIRNGHSELAKWLKEKLPTVSAEDMIKWVEEAATTGDLEMVKWLCGLLTERDANGRLCYSSEWVNLWRIVQSATDFGQLNVLLQWIMDEPNRTVLLHELISPHVEPEEIPPLKISFYKAAAGGHINFLAWLIEHYPEMCSDRHADLPPAANGHLDILHVLFSSSIGMRTSPRAINAAAENGHLDTVKFLVKMRYYVNYAMDDAAENGFLDVVRWLHENTLYMCTYQTRAMDKAAENGHLGVVKYLHRNRKEGCTESAMDCAVIQWLHENRTEGCTTTAMNQAARTGNLEMVK